MTKRIITITLALVFAFTVLGTSTPLWANSSAGDVPGTMNMAAITTLTPEADAFVEAIFPAINRGSSTQLRVDGKPVARTYVRFVVAVGTATISKVELRFFANSKSTGGYKVSRVADNSWTEGGIRYNNAPAVGSEINSSGAVNGASWTSVDVTAAVTGNGTYSFVLTSNGNTALSLSSRESSNRPQLIVTAASAATVTPTAKSTTAAATATRTATTAAATATRTATTAAATATRTATTAAATATRTATTAAATATRTATTAAATATRTATTAAATATRTATTAAATATVVPPTATRTATAVPPTATATATTGPSGTIATFSSDLKTVSVTYSGKTWSFQRPTTPATTFTPASGKTIWVAKSGSDSNSGTSTSPYLTIGKGIASAATGDVIYVKAGKYVETLYITTAGIVVSAAPGDVGNVVVTPPAAYASSGTGVITVHVVKNVTISGLVIAGYRGWSGAVENHFSENGITFEDGGAGTARNNVIYNNVHCGIKEMNHGGSGVVIEGNVILENGTNTLDHGIYAPMNDAVIRGNVIYNNKGFGVHSYPTPANQVIVQNVTWGNGMGGIIVAGSGTQVYNNTVAYDSRGIFFFRDGSHDNVIKNNLFTYNGRNGDLDFGGDALQAYPYNNTDDYNDYYPKTTSDPASLITLGANDLFADPLFVSPGTGDFRVSSGSPAVNRGVNVGLPFSGSAPTLGAYQ